MQDSGRTEIKGTECRVCALRLLGLREVMEGASPPLAAGAMWRQLHRQECWTEIGQERYLQFPLPGATFPASPIMRIPPTLKDQLGNCSPNLPLPLFPLLVLRLHEYMLRVHPDFLHNGNLYCTYSPLSVFYCILFIVFGSCCVCLPHEP